VQASIFLARLLGPLLLVTAIGLFANPWVFRTMAHEVVGSVTFVYLFGLMDFAAGLAIVLTHNVWVASWRVLITLIGRLMLATGWVMSQAAKILRNKNLYPVSGAVLAVLGLVLCYFGYNA